MNLRLEPRNASLKGGGGQIVPQGFQKEARLLTPWFYLSEAEFGPLTSRYARKLMCFVLKDHVCDHLSQ